MGGTWDSAPLSNPSDAGVGLQTSYWAACFKTIADADLSKSQKTIKRIMSEYSSQLKTALLSFKNLCHF